ncbi:hypothetical protein cypCar_00002101 [Cyprinus carpio]|nr:hypothetical protein cypCar_00002101 [Cyprinus carpio]
MSSHIVTPGPYRATKLWNEVTKLFRAGMPLKKHRQHFRVYTNCFTASAAVDWLHELLKNNSNFGPDVTRQQTVQLLKKFLKNHVIEDVKCRWGMEDLEDNSHLYRFPSTSPLKPIPNRAPVLRKKSISMMDRESFFKFRGSKKFDKEILENVDPETQESPVGSSSSETEHCRELTEDDIQVIWKNVTLTHLQKLVGSGSLEDVLDPAQVNPQFIIYNMTKVNKHGVVSLEDKTDDLPHWVLSAMKCLANFMCGYITAPKTQRGKRKSQEEPNCPQPSKIPYVNAANLFKSTECLLLSLIRREAFDEADSPMREVFSSKAETKLESHRAQEPVFRVTVLWFISVTCESHDVPGLLQPSLERVAIEGLQLCTLLLPPASRRKLQLLLRMISRMSQNVDMPRLHDIIGTRTLLVQTFSRCVLSCEEVGDLDELLATRLLSFLMDHHQEVLQVPVYLRNAVEDHISYLKSLTTYPGSGVAMPTYSFCRLISTQEFEEQKLSVSQTALADLLESLIKDKTMSVKEKKKKLKLFQKEYPDIYSRRFPTTESEAQLFADKPKIKPPMLLSIKKAKTFSIRN